MKNILHINWKKSIGSLFGILAVLLISLMIGAGLVLALNTSGTGWRVDNGQTKDVYYPSGGSNCARVTNNHGTSLFVPTKTTAEWNAFNSYKPSGVSVSSCLHSSCNSWAYTGAYYRTCVAPNNGRTYYTIVCTDSGSTQYNNTGQCYCGGYCNAGNVCQTGTPMCPGGSSYYETCNNYGLSTANCGGPR